MSTLKRLNSSHLFALTGGDGDLRAEILETFLASARASISELETAQSGDDWRRIAHKLKGLAASVGAEQLADLAAKASVNKRDEELLIAIRSNYAALSEDIQHGR
jgi:HPt (histidine-containing phosphotransfer) domain-containing protein